MLHVSKLVALEVKDMTCFTQNLVQNLTKPYEKIEMIFEKVKIKQLTECKTG